MCSDYSWAQVTETAESETMDKEVLKVAIMMVAFTTAQGEEPFKPLPYRHAFLFMIIQNLP